MTFFGNRKTEDENSTRLKPAMMPSQIVGFETVIGSDTTLLGELRCQADIRIDGTFDGVLEIEGNVLVGETGKINADIYAKNVVVAGAVRGNISGKKVQLLRTARVWGDISASAITTEEGAFIDGKLTMTHHDAAPEQLELTALPAPANNIIEGETLDS